MIILDTNVISEAFRPVPNVMVIDWVREQPEASLFLTIITVAELFAGIELMPNGRRRQDLANAIEETVLGGFSDRILPFDLAAARFFGTIRAERQLRGRGAQVSDLQIAAIARSRGMAVATRDSNGFADCGIPVINPWEHQETSP